MQNETENEDGVRNAATHGRKGDVAAIATTGDDAIRTTAAMINKGHEPLPTSPARD